MTLSRRFYTGTHDLPAMRALLVECKQINPYTGFHTGDLAWWAYYDPSGIPLEDKVQLWERDGRLMAWGWGNPKSCDFELALHPDLRGTDEEETILLTMIDWITQVTRSQPPSRDEKGSEQPRKIGAFAFDDEISRIALLEREGFTAAPWMVHFAQDLSGELPAPVVPQGFRLLERMSPEYIDERAAAHFDAFRPTSKMNSAYFRHFMTAPDYDPELDIVVLAPDGRVAGYAQGWYDAENQLSEYEPVGTRHEFHRRGVGRAALLAGLHRFKARGAKIATVSTGAQQEGNIAFYESAGFRIVNRTCIYEKDV
ncbi:MAG: GNAT family N-acetyltransferase [bacterium]|nr:GNAT family N-acetyltransferase [bacterium]